jgi:serine/threonine protein kinase
MERPFENCIVHRDIKTSNILLDDHLTAKISDFGASRGITIDESGVTTAVQGTYGYIDPEYFYTRRLTEKSDVYSYGVMLVELLTRKKPTIDMSLDGVSLVDHFVQLLSKDRLSEILDAQVTEEGEEEAKQVAAIAALCVEMKGNDRPTMRHVEMILQGIQSSNSNFQSNPRVLQIGLSNTIVEGSNIGLHDNSSRRCSMEREISVWKEKFCCQLPCLGDLVWYT